MTIVARYPNHPWRQAQRAAWAQKQARLGAERAARGYDLRAYLEHGNGD